MYKNLIRTLAPLYISTHLPYMVMLRDFLWEIYRMFLKSLNFFCEKSINMTI